MATLTVQSFDKDGLDVTHASAAGGGDVFANDATQRTFLSAKNGSGGAIVITITAQTTSATVTPYVTLTQANITFSLGAGEDCIIGPFNTLLFNNSSNQVAVTYDGVTSLTVAACKLLAP